MMESIRTFLFIAFAFLTFLLYQEWQKANTPPMPVQSEKTQVVSDASLDYEIPETPTIKESNEGELPKKATEQQDKSSSKQLITVETDTLRVQISPVRGDVVHAELLQYPVSLDPDSPPLQIFRQTSDRLYIAQAGLFGEGAPDQRRITTYRVEQTEYRMQDGQPLKVNLYWENGDGISYIKQFEFYPDSYKIDVRFIVTNGSGAPIMNRMFAQLKRDRKVDTHEESQGIGLRAYLGAAFSTEDDPYIKYDFDEMDEINLDVTTKGGWVAFLQHYFVSAWVPASEGPNQIQSKVEPNQISRIRIKQPWVEIAPGQTTTLAATLYVGPKIQERLEAVDENLDLTVDYGFLWWIGQPIFWLLKAFYSLVGNWGVAIILVTVVIKFLLYPLARAQYRSFAKMRLLQPKLEALKERYGDDRQQMSMKMMELYRKEKVNPLGGCFPLLIQMPVFLALYWVLMESVEMRHAPFMLWIKDLSVMDPYYVLPLLMGASMYLMQKMQPTSPTMDPMQQKMLQMMPVFMTIFFVFFPAGLVLYWLMNNLISIAQQLYITHQFNKEQAAKTKKG